MIPIPQLWLPIVVSAVVVFVASSILHMVLKYHYKDYRKLPDEDGILDTLSGASLTPGYYSFPNCSDPSEMGKPEVMEKFKRGPVGFLTVVPSGAPKLGKFLGQWFVYVLVVGIFIAYLTGRTHAAGTSYLSIFRYVGTVAFMTYGLAEAVSSIWKGAPWTMTCKMMVDGLVYALLTAGVFGWLWPA